MNSLESSKQMGNYGILCPPTTGHLNPSCSIGFELKQRGYRVILIGIMDVEQKAKRAGLEFQAVGVNEYPIGKNTEVFGKLGKLDGFKANQFFESFLADLGKIYLRDAPSIIRNHGINELIVDSLTPEGGTIAEHLQIPYVTLFNAVVANQESSVPPSNTSWNYDPTWYGYFRNQIGYFMLNQTYRPVLTNINQQRQIWGLKQLYEIDQTYSQFAQISQQVFEFEFPRKQLPTSFYFTGPLNTFKASKQVDFPYEKLTGQRMIYASMGTLQNRYLWIFKVIAEACDGLDAQLVIALGGGSSPDVLQDVSGNVIVVRYAPQLELLKQASLVITHAGMNTTMESLSNGVPMVAIPIANDQHAISARIVWSGTGEVVKLNNLNVRNLRGTVDLVLNQESYRKSARKIQQAIADAGSLSKASDIIEKVVYDNSSASSSQSN